MPHAEPVNWQPISQMPLIASMIDTALDDTREHIATLTEARTRPHCWMTPPSTGSSRFTLSRWSSWTSTPSRSAVGKPKAHQHSKRASWSGWMSKTGT